MQHLSETCANRFSAAVTTFPWKKLIADGITLITTPEDWPLNTKKPELE
jgi:hypothetical protein